MFLALGSRAVLVIPDIDLAQRVRQSSGDVGGDERVAGVGLSCAGIEVSDAAHRQAGQVGHGVTGCRSGRRDIAWPA